MDATTHKKCPRCGEQFQCSANNISECVCGEVELTEVEKAHLAEYFKDCVCVNCLRAIKYELWL
jgi:hypothetical protein